MYNVKVMGIDIDNPVVIASGPWTRGLGKLKKALECGAGALITETIVGESYPDTCPRYSYDRANGGMQNIRLYSGSELENWINDLEAVEQAGRFGSKTKLIASIMGTTASEVRYLAKKVERTGIDGIELGLACPIGQGPENICCDADKVYEYTREVVNAVNVPVSVKVGADCNLPAVVEAIEQAGAAGITGIDTIRCILSIDVESQKAGLPTYGGYSGAPIRPIALSTVAGIAQSTDLPVIGMGGIMNHINVLEHIMAGAAAGGIATGILLNGYGLVGKVIEDLEAWLRVHDVKRIEDIRGAALGGLKSFEEIKTEAKGAVIATDCSRPDCGKCAACCLEDAISTRDGHIMIDKGLCSGCGLCLDVCPYDKIKLTWK